MNLPGKIELHLQSVTYSWSIRTSGRILGIAVDNGAISLCRTNGSTVLDEQAEDMGLGLMPEPKLNQMPSPKTTNTKVAYTQNAHTQDVVITTTMPHIKVPFVIVAPEQIYFMLDLGTLVQLFLTLFGTFLGAAIAFGVSITQASGGGSGASILVTATVASLLFTVITGTLAAVFLRRQRMLKRELIGNSSGHVELKTSSLSMPSVNAPEMPG